MTCVSLIVDNHEGDFNHTLIQFHNKTIIMIIINIIVVVVFRCTIFLTYAIYYSKLIFVSTGQ